MVNKVYHKSVEQMCRRCAKTFNKLDDVVHLSIAIPTGHVDAAFKRLIISRHNIIARALI